MSIENFKSERVRRWRLLLEEYDYEFVYTPGKDNFVADMISRYPIINIGQDSIEDMNNVDEDKEFPLDFNVISKHQLNDTHLQKLACDKPKVFQTKFIHNIKLIFYNNNTYEL